MFELDGRGKTAARAYEAAGLLMLANADIVIAIWDQLPADGIGGTALIVEHAVAEGVPVILIDPRTPSASLDPVAGGPRFADGAHRHRRSAAPFARFC